MQTFPEKWGEIKNKKLPQATSFSQSVEVSSVCARCRSRLFQDLKLYAGLAPRKIMLNELSGFSCLVFAIIAFQGVGFRILVSFGLFLSHHRFLKHSLRILDLAFSQEFDSVGSKLDKVFCWLDIGIGKKNKKLTDIGLLQLFNDLGFQLFLVYQDFWI